MRIDLLTLFPEVIDAALKSSIMGRAQKSDLIKVVTHQLRDYSSNKHHTVDDRPYGGGPGMLLSCPPLFAAVETIKKEEPENPPHIVLLSPTGKLFQQKKAEELSQKKRLLLISGHYEGVDERVTKYLIDEEISIGDYILTNGTLPSLVIADCVARLIPGVLGNADSTRLDSFSNGEFEAPQYTRPTDFRGWKVPEILLSGDHAQIGAWRTEQARLKMKSSRPDLLK